MDGEIVVGTGKGVGDRGHGRKLFQQPFGAAVQIAVFLEDRALAVDRQSRVAQRDAAAEPALKKAVAVLNVSHKANPAGAGVDHPPDKRDLA